MKQIISLIICLFIALALPVSASITDAPLISPESARLDKNGLPYIKDTPEILWIDRIDGLPDYAKAFYNRLVLESSADGALVDVTKADKITLADGNTAYALTVTLTGEFFFDIAREHNIAQTRRNIRESITAEVSSIMSENWSTAAAYMISAEGAFDRDHPEVFWLGGKSRFACDISVGDLRFSCVTGRGSYVQHIYYILQYGDYDIRAEKYRDADVIRENIRLRDEATAEILAQVPENASDSEKIAAFNNALTHRNAYSSIENSSDVPHDARECISALDGRFGENGPVCEGYARAFKVLCDAAGIPCVLTDGKARTSADRDFIMHMWNSVQVDGKWYTADVTWNDPEIIGLSAAVSEAEAVSGWESEKWLLVGSDTIVNGLPVSESHIASNQVTEHGIRFTNAPVVEASSYAGRE